MFLYSQGVLFFGDAFFWGRVMKIFILMGIEEIFGRGQKNLGRESNFCGLERGQLF